MPTRRFAVLHDGARAEVAGHPYSLALNDARFWRGTMPGDDFFQSAKETFDTLYEEGETTPR